MPVLKAQAGGGVHVPPGSYEVLCTATRLDKIDNSKFGNGDVVRLDLQIVDVLDENGDYIELDAIANQRLTPKSKLWEWATAFGLPPVLNQNFDTDALVGRTAQALIIDKVEDGATFSRVDKIFPARASQSAPAAAATSNGDGPDFDGFWRRVKAGGFERKDVAPYVDNDLSTLQRKSQNELDGILTEMGV